MAHKYDLIVIEKELFPYCPSWIEKLLKITGKRYVVDYDDAIFHNYDLSSNPLIRYFLGKKIDRVMLNSHLVIAGNNYLAARAKKAGAKKIEIIPTVVDCSRYRIKEISDNKTIVIGWIGTITTLKYLRILFPILSQLAEKYPLQVHLVGINDNIDLDLPFFCKTVAWSEDSEVNSILNFDIGLMPLADTPWEKGKCAYKLIQYMACGIPVVASPIGMNVEVVTNEQNGFLASTDKEWFTALSTLISSSSLRSSFGKNGRNLVETKYNLQLSSLTIRSCYEQ